MKSLHLSTLAILATIGLAAAGCSPALESQEPSFTPVEETSSVATSAASSTTATSTSTSSSTAKNGHDVSPETSGNLTNPDGTYLITEKEPGVGKPERISQTWTDLDEHGFSKVTVNMEKIAQNAPMQFPFQDLAEPEIDWWGEYKPEIYNHPHANILLTYQTWDLDGKESLTNSCTWEISAKDPQGQETLTDVLYGYQGKPSNNDFRPDEVPERLHLKENVVRFSGDEITPGSDYGEEGVELAGQDGCFGTILAITNVPGEYTLEFSLAQKGFDPMVIHQPIRVAG